MEIVLWGYLVSFEVQRFRRYVVQSQIEERDPWVSHGGFDALKRAIKACNAVGRREAKGQPGAEVMVRVIDMKTGQEAYHNQHYGHTEVVVTVRSYR